MVELIEGMFRWQLESKELHETGKIRVQRTKEEEDQGRSKTGEGQACRRERGWPERAVPRTGLGKDSFWEGPGLKGDIWKAEGPERGCS
jgi:hypothetical protein